MSRYVATKMSVAAIAARPGAVVLGCEYGSPWGLAELSQGR
ncbi:MAG TPA: hypothetical protein VIQ76_18790 [Propionibacteriaceae bacterium]